MAATLPRLKLIARLTASPALRCPSSQASTAAPQIAHESETLTRFEVMDGCPVRGERIPLRLYLSGLSDLSPSYPNVANSFSVRYFLNLVLVDEEDRRYFKQQEITLWRKDLAPPKMFP